MDDKEEADVGSSVTSIDDSVLKEDDADDDPGTKMTHDMTSSSGRGKKRPSTATEKDDNASILPLKKDIGKLVSTSAQVIQQIAARRADKETCNYRHQQELDEDKDWIFAKLIYGKMKQIPDGFEKDDLQVEIQKLINDTRKRNDSSATSMPAAYYPCNPYQEYRNTQRQAQQQPYSASQHSAAATSNYQCFSAQPQPASFSGQLAAAGGYPSSSYTVLPQLANPVSESVDQRYINL